MADTDTAVTAVITSCGRMRQLKRLLDSVHRFVDHPLERILLIEDSGDARVHEVVEASGMPVEVHVAPIRRGQLASIDAAYAMTRTPWILHLEDDYVFERRGYVADALAVLRAAPKITVASGRRWGPLFASRPAPVRRIGGVDVYLPPRSAHPSWFGYAFHTGLRRRREWERFGPFAPYQREWDVSYAMKRAGLQMAYLVNDAYRDDDMGEPSAGSDPARPKGLARTVYRLRKAAKKRLFEVEKALGRYDDRDLGEAADPIPRP